jgi:hypothetical protein
MHISYNPYRCVLSPSTCQRNTPSPPRTILQDDPRWYVADPICTFLFAGLVLWTTRIILRDIADVLMERAPRGINIMTLNDDLTRVSVGALGGAAGGQAHLYCPLPACAPSHAPRAAHLSVVGTNRWLIDIAPSPPPPRSPFPRPTWQMPGVQEIHDLHVWSLKPGIPLLCAHVVLTPTADPTETLHAVTTHCRALRIQHTTIQLVTNDTLCPCGTKSGCC